jgi:hypothetical protein
MPTRLAFDARWGPRIARKPARARLKACRKKPSGRLTPSTKPAAQAILFLHENPRRICCYALGRDCSDQGRRHVLDAGSAVQLA